jgi:hypothetical protein
VKHSTVSDEPSRVLRAHSSIRKRSALVGVCFVVTATLVVSSVLESRLASVAAATANPVVVVAGDIACGPTDPNFGGANPVYCQQRATASLVASIQPNYLLPGGDTQYTPNEAVGQQPTPTDYSQGYDASWGQLQNPASSNYVPGLVVRPTPGDHEYGDANENDSGPLSDASNYYANFGPSGLNDLPAGVTGPSSDFYSFDIPVTGGTWHVISLDSQCAALPTTVGGPPSESAAGCAVGSPEETFLRNDLNSHQGECTLIHWHSPLRSEVFGYISDYQALWNDAANYHVTLIVNGHAHDYERWVPMDANGNPSATGVTQIIAGTGGFSHVSNSSDWRVKFHDASDFGVLRLTLNATSANFAFKTVSGTTPDSGNINCQGLNVPTVTGVSPTSGPLAGGTSVKIAGTSFTGATAVKFGSTNATSFKVNSATSITATLPPEGAATVDITVTTENGTSAPSALVAFTFTGGYSTKTLTLTVGNETVKYRNAIISSATVTGLKSGDTATVSGVAYTYAGVGLTTYGPSATAPTAVGTYSVTPSGGTVTVTPSPDQANYSTTYTYAAGTLTISAKVLIGPHAIRTVGAAWTGQTVAVSIIGLGFYGRPKIVSSTGSGTTARVTGDTGTVLTVRVTVKPGTPRGIHIFKITLADGKFCNVRYKQR